MDRLMFHNFTGSDNASAFAGRGEKTAWERVPDVT